MQSENTEKSGVPRGLRAGGIFLHSEIDRNFIPLSRELASFRARAAAEGAERLTMCVTGAQCGAVRYGLDVFREEHAEENLRIAERMLKSLLWTVGGGEVLLSGPAGLTRKLAEIYSPTGARAFDADIMKSVYGNFSVQVCGERELPAPRRTEWKAGGNLSGFRIGLDAGATNLKVCAVAEGKQVFAESVPWKPRSHSDPKYHFERIGALLARAAEFLPRLDAIGVSTAGITVGDRVMTSSLFTAITDPEKRLRAQNLFLDLGKKLGAPVRVANDGDVAALAGCEGCAGGTLGISMGSSEAGGYVGADGCLNGWISEFAFVPVDLSPSGGVDEWSGDVGCGVNYLSQDGVARLGRLAGMELPGETHERFKEIRARFAAGDPTSREIFRTLGVYLGWELALYAEFYSFERVLLLGGVTVGECGDLICRTAEAVLKKEFPHLAGVKLKMPEGGRGTAQSFAAARL